MLIWLLTEETANLLDPRTHASTWYTLVLCTLSWQRVLEYAHSTPHPPIPVAHNWHARIRHRDTLYQVCLHRTRSTEKQRNKRKKSIIWYVRRSIRQQKQCNILRESTWLCSNNTPLEHLLLYKENTKWSCNPWFCRLFVTGVWW